MLQLPRYEFSGSAAALGAAQGDALRPLIQRFVPMRFDACRQYAAEAGGDVSGLMDVGRASFAIFERWDPEAFAEHVALAAAAGVDPVELFTVGNMTDMRDALLLSFSSGAAAAQAKAGARAADAEGCSSVLIPGAHAEDRRPIAGQTWDLNPEDVDYVVAVGRRPDRGVPTWAVTVAGCPTLVGMNAYGLSVGTTNIKTWGSRPGVGYLNLLHRAIACANVAEAVDVIRDAPRAGAHTYWLADDTRQVELETSPERVVLREATGGPVIRTNHCLAPEVVAQEWQPPSPSSLQRLSRLTALLGEAGQSAQSLRRAFGDRSDGVNSVSRHAADGQGTATNAVIVAQPAERRLYACRGPAEQGEWVELWTGQVVAL